MYIKGQIIAIEDNLIRIRNIKYPDIVVTINRDSQMDEVVLQYLPPLNKIKLGTKIWNESEVLGSKMNQAVSNEEKLRSSGINWVRE